METAKDIDCAIDCVQHEATEYTSMLENVPYKYTDQPVVVHNQRGNQRFYNNKHKPTTCSPDLQAVSVAALITGANKG